VNQVKLPAFLQRALLAGAALFAMCWVIARAWVQSITIDEADCFLTFVASAAPLHWDPASQNHLLNTILMRFSTSLFGLSHLTVRAPALIGAAVYILAAYKLCRLLTADWRLQLSLLLCLVYNPFIMDFLVAARGYSLATAFLMGGLAIAVEAQAASVAGRSRSLTLTCALCSICAALSLAANFAFAFVLAAAMLMLLLWAFRRPEASKPKILAACIAPGLLVTLFFSGWALLRWPQGQLWWGATSLRETLSTIVEASLFELNPHIVNPLLYPALERLKPILLPLLGALCALQFLLIFLNRSSLRDVPARWLLALAGMLAAMVALSLSAHWLSFRLFGLLLPKGRTGIYLVPSCMLIAGAAAAFPLASRAGLLCRRAIAVVLFALGGYFLLCLRLAYFHEWKWDADVRSAYSVVAQYNHNYGVKEVPSGWMYAPSLNFYRHLSGRETLTEFVKLDKFPVGKRVYVLNAVMDRHFIAEQELKVVYYGGLSHMVVAIRPEVETAAPCRPCGEAAAR